MFGPIDAIMARTASNGGGTFHPITGESPKDGFMVAMPGGVTLPDLGEIKAALRRFLLAMQTVFTGNPSVYLGTWIDSQTGRVFIDPAIRIPDRETAVAVAETFGQIAIWDVAESKEIRLHAGAVNDDPSTKS